MERPDSSEIRSALLEVDVPLDLLVERMLGLAAPIDWVCKDADGGVVLAHWAAPGESLQQFGHLKAQLDWLAPRLADWQRLAPERGLDPTRPPSGLLVANEFCPRTRQLAGRGDAQVSLMRWVRLGGRGWLLGEGGRHAVPAAGDLPPAVVPTARTGTNSSLRSVISLPGSHFRTRLRDEDL